MAEEKPEAAGAASEEPKVDSRGQISVPLGDPPQDYVLRPSHEAIMAIERQTRPLFQLSSAAEAGALTLEEQAICVVELMKAYGTANPEDELASDYRGANVKKVGALIHEAGSFRICARLYLVLSGALFGGYTASGEVKAATETAKP